MKVKVSFRKVVEDEMFVEITKEEYKFLKRYNETDGFLDLPDDEYNAMDDPEDTLCEMGIRLEHTVGVMLNKNEWIEDYSLGFVYDVNENFILEN